MSEKTEIPIKYPRYFKDIVITTVIISLDIGFVIDLSVTVLIYAIEPKNSVCNMARPANAENKIFKKTALALC